MTITFPDVGLSYIFTNVLSSDMSTYLVHLFTSSSVTPGSSTVLSDVSSTEANFGGYSATALGAAGTPGGGGGTETGAYGSITFTVASTTNVPQTCYGFYITDSGSSQLICCANFDSPLTVASVGDEIIVDLSLALS